MQIKMVKLSGPIKSALSMDLPIRPDPIVKHTWQRQTLGVYSEKTFEKTNRTHGEKQVQFFD